MNPISNISEAYDELARIRESTTRLEAFFSNFQKTIEIFRGTSVPPQAHVEHVEPKGGNKSKKGQEHRPPQTIREPSRVPDSVAAGVRMIMEDFNSPVMPKQVKAEYLRRGWPYVGKTPLADLIWSTMNNYAKTGKASKSTLGYTMASKNLSETSGGQQAN
jgi:hypothetical protein